jgi:hypothetical protein
VAESVSADLAYILVDAVVVELVQYDFTQHYRTVRRFSTLGEDRASVRAALLAEFGLNPATGAAVRAQVGAVVSAWEASSEFIEETDCGLTLGFLLAWQSEQGTFAKWLGSRGVLGQTFLLVPLGGAPPGEVHQCRAFAFAVSACEICMVFCSVCGGTMDEWRGLPEVVRSLVHGVFGNAQRLQAMLDDVDDAKDLLGQVAGTVLADDV